MFISELEILANGGQKSRRLRTGFASGSAVSQTLMNEIRESMGVDKMLVAYGTTETSPVSFITSLDDPEDKRISTIGRVMPHMVAKVVDKQGRIVPRGQKGELCVSGYALQNGYWKNEEKTREAMKRGPDGVLWRHIVDEVAIHEEGYGHLTGRVKDLIIRGGENSFPREIEDRLVAHGSISESSVIGIKDEKYGEVQGVETVGDDFPEAGSGKHQKHQLRDAGNRVAAYWKPREHLEIEMQRLLSHIPTRRSPVEYLVAPSSRVGSTIEPAYRTRPAVRIVEVGPRDGLQNIRQSINSATRLELIRRQRDAGLQTIELTLFVSPLAILQLADAQTVVQSPDIQSLPLENPELRLPVLVPNLKGLEKSLQNNIKEVAGSRELERAREVASKAASAGLSVRGYVSCILPDPYKGPTLPPFCAAAPAEVRKPVTYLRGNGVPLEKLAGHFHGTYGSAVATVWEAYKCGLRAFDSSVAGLGGCPFAPGARGNVASEDLVYMQLSIPNSSRGGAALLMKRKQKAGHKPFKSTRSLSWKVIQETEGLQLFRSGVNLKINLNRPKNGNALTVARVQDLTAVLLHRDGPGQGEHGSGPGDSSSNAQFNKLTNFFEASDQSPKVTIACLNGPAFGGGVGLASACDLRYAVKGASVTLSEVKLGLCAATISRYVIREWGVAFAREAMLSARSAAAEELIARGLVVAIADSVEALDWPLDGALIGMGSWGNDEQAKGIRALFDGMMRPDGEGSYGVKEFQAKRPVDWDAYTLRQVERAKL
ncbi:hypothetical protein BDW71DRAFT_207209 [Aspergillus fruticulosus]